MSAFPPKSLQNTVKRRGKNTNNFGKPSKTDVFLIKNPFPMKKRLAFVFFKNKTLASLREARNLNYIKGTSKNCLQFLSPIQQNSNSQQNTKSQINYIESTISLNS